MTFWTFLKTIAAILPEIINLIKWANDKIETGIDTASIKKAISDIDKAFTNDNPQQKAKELNDVFKNK